MRLARLKVYAGVFNRRPNPGVAAYATTQYDFDALDRLTRVTDAAGNLTRLTYDGLGRKTQLQDPDMGTWSYDYLPLGQLAAQTDALGQRIEFAYDALGRETRRWASASATGPWTTPSPAGPSVYDVMELRAVVDANRVAAGLGGYAWTDPAVVAGTGVPVRAVHVTDLQAAVQGLWTAAGLGTCSFTAGPIVAGSRVIKGSDLADGRGWVQSYESSSSGSSSYGQSRRARVLQQYDAGGAGANALGRRTGLWDAAGRSTWAYDAAGRVTSETRWLDGFSYTTSSTYDGVNRVVATTLPDGEVLTSSYGADGRPSSLSSSLGGSYAANAQYSALGQPTQLDLGGSSGSGRVAHTYFGLEGAPSSGGIFGALKSTQWPAASPSLVNRTLGYDAAGNVTSVADGVNGESISYQYDDLDRLLSARVPSGERFAYDALGNLTSKGGQSLSYPAAGQPRPHAASSFGGTSYGYDANGSVTSKTVGGVTTSFAYDAERRPVRVSQGSRTLARFAYDGDGVRRKRLDQYGVIHYVSGSYEVDKGDGRTRTTDTVTKLYRVAGRLIAVRKGGVLSYVGTDHLGSVIQVTDSSFGALADGQQRYTPFGTSRDSGAGIPTDHRFTSQIRDASIGLDWYQSRAYDPTLGRFCQPDTIVPSPGDPQSLNRYSYVRNNPLGRIDPTGRTDVDVSTYAGRQAFREANPGMDWATWNDRLGRGFSLTDATGDAYTPAYYTPGSPQWQDPPGEQQAAQAALPIAGVAGQQIDRTRTINEAADPEFAKYWQTYTDFEPGGNILGIYYQGSRGRNPERPRDASGTEWRLAWAALYSFDDRTQRYTKLERTWGRSAARTNLSIERGGFIKLDGSDRFSADGKAVLMQFERVDRVAPTFTGRGEESRTVYSPVLATDLSAGITFVHENVVEPRRPYGT